jgi:hypothetical protein
LKNTDHGSTLVILPWLSVYPAGEFIHEFAAITDMAPSIPATTIGIPLHQCAQGGSRCHPYRYTPTKIASRKKKIPSIENGKPIAAPNRPIRRIGHMSSRNIGAVALVILLGLVVGTLGLVEADLYAVGVLILFLGSVGAAVLAGEYLIRYLSSRRPPA